MQLLNLKAVLMYNLNRSMRQSIIRDIQLIQRMQFILSRVAQLVVTHVHKHALKAIISYSVIDQVNYFDL
jgi:hypothetical protein